MLGNFIKKKRETTSLLNLAEGTSPDAKLNTIAMCCVNNNTTLQQYENKPITEQIQESLQQVPSSTYTTTHLFWICL